MAYDTNQRFANPPIYYRTPDPTAYQNANSTAIKPNNVAFLSKTSRDTYIGAKLWTHSIYYAGSRERIPNCTSLQSKVPRFPYVLSDQDIRDILCRCGLRDPCECPVEEEDESKKQVVCQANVRRQIFKGITFRRKSDQDDSLNIDFKEISSNGPPFYDAKVNESTSFYRGWKWSKWTALRIQKISTDGPGPAEYDVEPKPNFNQICDEKVRAEKRKTSKQLRFIESIQRQNIIDIRPGPASYSPILPKGSELQYIGPKAERFPRKFNVSPGPADYWIKRNFELPEVPDKQCHAKIPPSAPFGVNAIRLKHFREEGTSPASYSAAFKPYKFMRCSSAPFDSTSVRFKETRQDDENNSFDEGKENSEEKKSNYCGPIPSWQFKSKTIRINPSVKKYNEPSPADLPQTRNKIQRLSHLQSLAPFFSSQRRFMPWYNEIPVFGRIKTPGPGYYCLEKFKRRSAVYRGPIYRTQRFPCPTFITPAPNHYKVEGGIEDTLSTHNQKLKSNIANQHKFHWEPVMDPIKLTFEEQEAKLLEQSIKLLEPTKQLDNKSSKSRNRNSDAKDSIQSKQKLLRCFLYKKQIKPSY